MRKDFTITITMESDWHIGTGAGKAKEVDRLVRKDKKGLPIIPGRTLKGILKDSAEVIAGGLGGTWPDWVDHVFGDSPAELWQTEEGSPRSPLPGALDIRSAELSPALRSALAADQGLIPFLYTTRPGVAVSKEGVAKDDFLRLEERTRGGLTLTARASLEGSEDSINKATALLAAAAAWTVRLGGKRRRGAGKCTIVIEGMTSAAAAGVIDKDPGSPPEVVQPESSSSAGNGVEPTSTFRLKLRTLSPLCMTSKVEGNVVFSNDCIPGGMLLGAIGSAMGEKAAAFWKAVDAGNVRVSFGMPRFGESRGLPMPFAIEHRKGDEKKIRNGFIAVREAYWKQARKGYWAKSGEEFIWDSPKKSVISHNVIEDQHQRPTSAVGGVFTYHSVDSHTPYECLVTLPSSLAKELEGKTLRIGRSKSVEYGEVQVESVEAYEAGTKDDSRTEVSMQVVSPLLLRDKRTGVWVPTLERLLTELKDKLGVEPTVQENDRGPMVELRPIEVQTWNVKGRTPRPSAVGLQPGSCLKLKFEPGVTLTKLKELELKGMGERLAEGFGEVAFNPEILTLQKAADAAKAEWEALPSQSQGDLDQREVTLMQSLKRNRLLEQIRQNCLGSLATENRHKELIPKNPGASQLGNLRSLVSALPGSEAHLRKWIDKAADHKTRASDWGDSLSRIKALIDDHSSIRPIVAPGVPADDPSWDEALDWKAIQIAYDAVLRFIREDERRKEAERRRREKERKKAMGAGK